MPMKVKDDILLRVYITFLLLMLTGAAVVFQAFRIQVFQGDEWRTMADSLSTAYHTIEAKRGNIYTENGRLLATSLPYFEIGMDPNISPLTSEVFYAKVDSLALMLSQHFKDRTSSQYRNLLTDTRKTGKRYVRIRSKISYNDLQAVRTFPLFRDGQFAGGLVVFERKQRHYPYGKLAHRTIGYVRTGPGSKSVGIEQAFNDYLTGVDGKQLMQKIAGSTWKPINDDADIKPHNGLDLISTIDIEIQDAAESALEDALRKHNAKHGCAIVMEVATGKVRAIANLGLEADSSYFEKYNYAIGEATEPGSTFKTATIMAMLEDGLIKLTDTVDITGGQITYAKVKMRDSEWHNHTSVSVAKAFEISSNVGISKIAKTHYGNDPEAFIGRLRQFHLDRKTEIEIRGEANPFISSPGRTGWSKLSVPWISVGYEVRLTPLQVLAFYNAIANGGTMMKPYLVSSIEEYGRTKQQFQSEVLRDRICSNRTIELITELLVGAVDSGTARAIRSANFTIAGKTGTAQIADDNRGYQKIYQSSFAGFFPADNPMYSCIVVVNSPSQGGYYGGTVAAPVFREIADKIYASHPELFQKVAADSALRDNMTWRATGYGTDLMRIARELDLTYHKLDAEWLNMSGKHDSAQVTALTSAQKNTAPDVRGMGLRDALPLLENAGLKVEVRGIGQVRHQSIHAGQAFMPGQTIVITLE